MDVARWWTLCRSGTFTLTAQQRLLVGHGVTRLRLLHDTFVFVLPAFTTLHATIHYCPFPLYSADSRLTACHLPSCLATSFTHHAASFGSCRVTHTAFTHTHFCTHTHTDATHCHTSPAPFLACHTSLCLAHTPASHTPHGQPLFGQWLLTARSRTHAHCASCPFATCRLPNLSSTAPFRFVVGGDGGRACAHFAARYQLPTALPRACAFSPRAFAYFAGRIMDPASHT